MSSLINNHLLVEVIKYYGLRTGNIDSYPSFHVLKTDRGTKVLTIWNDAETLKEAFRYKELLVKLGFRKINRFIRTKDGAPYVEMQEKGYSLTDLIGGMMPTANRNKDMQIVGATLAEFHTALLGVSPDRQFELWSDHFNRGYEHFKSTEKELKEKANKVPLDIKLLKDMSKHLEQAKQSILMAKKVEKNDLRKGLNARLCHGNLRLSSFRLDEFGEGWLNDLGIPIVDQQAYDIAKLITRVYKQSSFSKEAVYSLLDSYQQNKPLQVEDKLWILTYIAYPHEIWKFIYVYYRVKIPHPENLVDQYDKLIEQQINLGILYQNLFTYFEL